MGLVGVLSGKSGGDVKQFLPEYITELAGQERVKRELEIAHQVQSSFLPRQMPKVNGLDIAGMCLPATEVGGDYFDFIKISKDRLAFVVGDVSGKGIQAAFYMTFVKGIIQTLSTAIESPAEVMRRTNRVFGKNAPAGTFISMIYGVVDVSTNTFTFSRAGHNPAILKRLNTVDAEPLQPKGMAIGFPRPDIFDENIEEQSIQLGKGDTLVFYTDGFSEAMNSARELYSDERIVEKVGHVGSKSSGAILRALTEDVHHFIEGHGRSDDMTMVVIKMTQ
jgi:sigma-B regulation protein RsbU (phosphoserine phosphatase)